jgi:hypothetical protein
MLLPPGREFTAARGGPADDGRRRSVQVVGRRAIAESLKHLSHQALDSGTVSSLAMKLTMDPKLAAKEPLVSGPSPGPSWGRETAINSGQSQCPADNDIGRSTAVIRRHRPAGPYMACKGSVDSASLESMLGPEWTEASKEQDKLNTAIARFPSWSWRCRFRRGRAGRRGGGRLGPLNGMVGSEQAREAGARLHYRLDS